MINHGLFFDAIRGAFGPFQQGQVDGIDALLFALDADPDVALPSHAAYMLATAWHETAATMQPIEERGGDAYFIRRYSPGTRVGRALGNVSIEDAVRYRGRGYVQLTGRRNYAKAGRILGTDLEGDPDRALHQDVAYRILSRGMRDGWFTGRALAHYLTPARTDYVGARRIINGTDRAETVAVYAMRFEAALREARA